MGISEKARKLIGTGILIVAAVVMVVTAVVFYFTQPKPPATKAAPPTSNQAWCTWAEDTCQTAFQTLHKQGAPVNNPSHNLVQPLISLVEGKLTFGNAAIDSKYLENTGELHGKIALFFLSGGEFSYIVKYNATDQFNLRDEVVDASPYVDNQRAVSMPFTASRYATSPQDCTTLVIVVADLAPEAEGKVNDATSYADTEVVIINTKSKTVQHIEYLGTCLAETTTENIWGSLMKGEALSYLASLSVDGTASKSPYTTPYQTGRSAGAQPEVSDENWMGKMVQEGFLATGEFGDYNTLVMNVVERDTPLVSQQKVTKFALRLYRLENGKVVVSKNYGSVRIVSPHPDDLHLEFGGDSSSLTANINAQDMSGTVTLSGAAPKDFYAKGVGAAPCPDCKQTGLVNGQPDPRCGGIGFLVLYQGQDL